MDIAEKGMTLEEYFWPGKAQTEGRKLRWRQEISWSVMPKAWIGNAVPMPERDAEMAQVRSARMHHVLHAA